ncbi:MAG TPA: threonine synthase [Candidatus Saccharimonadales bacterium]|nr:threonine synthase [Candidatus Saccharimonadales bacterium]
MLFYSTKKISPEVDFKTALFNGLAPDGGLYMPVAIQQITIDELNSIKTLRDAGFVVLRKWIDKKEISDDVLKQIVKKALNFPTPTVKVGEQTVLELFHGPTLAFKDFGAGVLAQLFEYFLEKENKNIIILVATSGDTGGAMAQAFSGLTRVKLVILYPKGKISELQEEQLTRVGKNVLTLSIDGVFDDCQKYTKIAFQDPDLTNLNLSSANSINIGRLIPQIIYYVWTYARIKESLRFVIPSGNMGNATACLFAQKMGVPISKIIVANNQNDAAVRYYKTGKYEEQKTIETLSNAMDIGNPNNLERVLDLYNYDHKEFCKHINAVKVTDKKTIETIKKVYSEHNYLLDFHSAVAYSAAEKIGSKSIVVSTASPLKFAKEISKETGIKVDNSGLIKELRKKEKRVVNCDNDYESVKRLLKIDN